MCGKDVLLNTWVVTHPSASYDGRYTLRELPQIEHTTASQQVTNLFCFVVYLLYNIGYTEIKIKRIVRISFSVTFLYDFFRNLSIIYLSSYAIYERIEQFGEIYYTLCEQF